MPSRHRRPSSAGDTTAEGNLKLSPRYPPELQSSADNSLTRLDSYRVEGIEMQFIILALFAFPFALMFIGYGLYRAVTY